SPMSEDVYKSWFRVSGIQNPAERLARSIAAKDRPFGGIKALSQAMGAEPASATVRATWAKIEALYARHPDWLHALRAADCDLLDVWAMSHRARLLADLTELGGRASSDVMIYDELRELAYMVATLTEEQDHLSTVTGEDRL